MLLVIPFMPIKMFWWFNCLNPNICNHLRAVSLLNSCLLSIHERNISTVKLGMPFLCAFSLQNFVEQILCALHHMYTQYFSPQVKVAFILRLYALLHCRQCFFWYRRREVALSGYFEISTAVYTEKHRSRVRYMTVNFWAGQLASQFCTVIIIASNEQLAALMETCMAAYRNRKSGGRIWSWQMPRSYWWILPLAINPASTI